MPLILRPPSKNTKPREKPGTLAASREPRANSDELTVKQLCNHFLTAKKLLVESDEITRRTFLDYKLTTDRLVSHLGDRLVADLRAADFEQLRADIAKTRGPVALGNEVQRCRVVFKYGYDADLIDRPIKYGPTFKRPSRKVLRIHRKKMANGCLRRTKSASC